jgi:hypothetical protein
LENYTSYHELAVDIVYRELGTLAIVGRTAATAEDTYDYKILASFVDITIGEKIEVEFGPFWHGSDPIPLPGIWWAVESVTSDPAYPYLQYAAR